MVVRRRPSTARMTGAWKTLLAKPNPTRPTLGMGDDKVHGNRRFARKHRGSIILDAVTTANQRELLNTALAGRYTIERELGRGGMATVYLANDVKHRRPVA